MKRLLLLALFLISLMTQQACAQPFEEKLASLYKYTVPQIQPQELLALKQENPKLVILDTRSAKEYAVSHVQGATFVDYDNFNAEAVAHIPKDAQVVVYCTVGYRSERIGEQLQALGYPQVKNMYGGIFQWKNEGLPVVDDKGQPTERVHTYNLLWSQWLTNGEKVY